MTVIYESLDTTYGTYVNGLYDQVWLNKNGCKASLLKFYLVLMLWFGQDWLIVGVRVDCADSDCC